MSKRSRTTSATDVGTRTTSAINEDAPKTTATKKITYTFVDGTEGTLTVSDTWDKRHQLRAHIASHYPHESYRIIVREIIEGGEGENTKGSGDYTILIKEYWYHQFLNWLSYTDVDVSGVRYSKDKKDYSDQEKIIVQELLKQFFVDKLNGTGIHLDLTLFYKHFDITSIKNCAFKGLCFFKSITIPDGVTSIGTSAFAETAIESVVIPDSVEYIGPWAFDSCVNLTKVVLPSNLELIEFCTFQNTKLQSIDIPHSVRTIQFGAFMNAQLTTVRFPESWKDDGQCDITGGAFVQNGTLGGEQSLPVGTSISQGVFDDHIRVEIKKQRITA